MHFHKPNKRMLKIKHWTFNLLFHFPMDRNFQTCITESVRNLRHTDRTFFFILTVKCKLKMYRHDARSSKISASLIAGF